MSNKAGSNLFFLALGAALGAAVGYVVASDKKEDWLKEVNILVDKVKGNVVQAVQKAKCKVGECGCTEEAENVE